MTEMQTVRTLDTVAAEIRTFTASLLNNVIEIGRRLCEAKEMLPYGEFGRWVKENTAYSLASANNFMRLFNEYGSAQGCLFGAEAESQTFGKLSYSKALALLAVPAEEREEFVRENDVDGMSTRELAEAIRERDAARAAAEAAEKQAEASELLRAELSDKYEGSKADLAYAEARIRELESRPVEVAVQEPDPEELERRIDEAVQEAEKRAEEERDALKEKLKAAKQAKKDMEAEAEKARQEAEQAGKQLEEVRAASVSPEEKERMEREIETLQKKLAMSDAAVASFRTLFDQTQDILNRLLGSLLKVENEETKEKLQAAVRELLNKYGEKMNA